MDRTVNKDMKRLLRKAVKLGATLEQGRKHVKVRCPNGALVIVASTPSEHRAVLNARARLQRQGGLDLG
jgi:hypothetical protein